METPRTVRHSADEKRRRFARRFARQVVVWAVVCAFLAFVNRHTSPHHWWVAWVAAGWGLQLLLTLVCYLFDLDGEDGEDEKEEQAAR